MGCSLYYSVRVSASYLDIAEKVGNTKAVRAIGGQIVGIQFNNRSMSPCNRKEWKACWICRWFMEERVVIKTRRYFEMTYVWEEGLF